MTLTSWLIYVAAVVVLTLTPGPTVLMCVSTAVNSGPRKALVACLGSTTAIVGIMALSALGLGTALAASGTAFQVLKWLGAAYLVYLGVRSLWSSFSSSASEIQVHGAVQSSTNSKTFAQGFLVGASNPKALLFFGALFPQFITPGTPQLPQFLLLGVTFVFFEALWLTLYALSAARAKRWLQQPRRAQLFNRVTGVVFLLAAALVAGSRRTSAA
jgi:threonine/homoserine/homoserine lactone efflux protein